jgi:hypothetical protein
MRQSLACLLTLPLMALFVTPMLAQEPLTDGDKAVAAFDVYLDRLTSSDVAKSTGMDDPGKAMPMAPKDDIDMKEVRRIFGAVSAPADMAAVENRQGTDPLPLNFFLRVQFKSEAAAQKTFQGMAEKGQQVTLAGKEYFRPPADDGDTPGNLLLHMVSPDVMEIGTEGFVLQSSRHVFTDNLLASWQKMPKAAIRISADLDGARHLIDQGMQAAQAKGIPAPAMPAVAIVENAAGLRLALDFSSNDMLWLTVTGKDSGATGTIKTTLDGFLAMGKGMGQQMIPSIPGENLQKVAGTMLDALATTQDSNDVNLVLPRPEGFEEAIGEVVPMVMGAMMGGMGGPGGPGGPGGAPFGSDGGADPFGGAPEPEPAAAGTDPFGGDPFE